MNFWHAYIVGIAVLLVAIILNWLASLAGLATWYVFLTGLREGFWSALGEHPVLSLLFLFVLYPGLLGFSALLVASWLG